MKNRPKPVNPAMPTNIATLMIVLSVIAGILVGWLLPFEFDGSFIWGVIVVLAFNGCFVALYRRYTIRKQKAVLAQQAATKSETTTSEK